ncbi:Wzz/FepE/Etk N-terminal domain-containing protein [Pseudoalteromonas luteoviolacea]|uniref:Polysaccharide chain length determinant N-terminal domain-containing protein n=1 Tax=Pseudoalteromonas luteoviolacea H33 TaxID=1365251 RepID=A0A167EYM3_9GAMM|nr:Wzz/FepE/Etk N-terminal domain-containing protein [Pseudoalteromonas luteoviolacea]KZN51370.1 hypothetical protein N476_13360 [Pseudoalteromonas luteoviolacea H33]KZN71459.1 hypothetical protein N477_04060 [Pseudoalteromonas luteoviolacea H33-S]MBQ4876814.1 LPS O-antigen length regulator [Pseudoalteromonas luteoviolacea]MBQ4905397.1 LPS O-antigen length regulator [Pseudoalteromonas luteoviolacea]
MNRESNEKTIHLSELVSVLWQKKWWVLIPTIVSAIISVYLALGMTNIYRSSVTLAPTESLIEGHGSSGFGGGLGGLAQLAGVGGANSKVDRIDLAIEIMKSKAFVFEFIQSELELAELIAVKHWHKNDNIIEIDSTYFDVETGDWKESPFNDSRKEPEKLNVYKYFIENVLDINQDKSTGIITVSMEHESPYYAKSMLDKFIVMINNKIKDNDIRDAQESLSFLEARLEVTNVATLQTSLYSLMHKEMQTIMLANSKAEYIFKTIDPAFVDENKVAPRRAFIVILAVFFTFVAASTIQLLRFFWKK